MSCILCLATLMALPTQQRDTDADQPVFSGPQVGEKLVPFQVRGIFGELAGKEVDLISQAKGQPLVIIFVHELTRPSVGLTRLIMQYVGQRSEEGLCGGVVWLTDDMTAMEARLNRARHALPRRVAMGISPDGQEGPGAYGLNRSVTLTVLVGKDNKVTANFPLVQPSIQADAPKILHAIVEVMGGGKVPSLAELAEMDPQRPAMRGSDEPDPMLRGLLRPVIQKKATPQEVRRAAMAVEEYVSKNPQARRQLGDICHRIEQAGKLADYGTAAAQEWLQKWAKEYHVTDPQPRQSN